MGVFYKSHVLPMKAAITEHNREMVKRAASQVLSDARARVPVQTGYLKNSGHLRFEDGGMSCTIAFSANYAAYVELGTSRRGATPFLKPAFDLAMPAFKASLV